MGKLKTLKEVEILDNAVDKLVENATYKNLLSYSEGKDDTEVIIIFDGDKEKNIKDMTEEEFNTIKNTTSSISKKYMINTPFIIIKSIIYDEEEEIKLKIWFTFNPNGTLYVTKSYDLEKLVKQIMN